MYNMYMNDPYLGLKCGRKEGKKENRKAQSKEK
jgi:hypothetical protein